MKHGRAAFRAQRRCAACGFYDILSPCPQPASPDQERTRLSRKKENFPAAVARPRPAAGFFPVHPDPGLYFRRPRHHRNRQDPESRSGPWRQTIQELEAEKQVDQRDQTAAGKSPGPGEKGPGKPVADEKKRKSDRHGARRKRRPNMNNMKTVMLLGALTGIFLFIGGMAGGRQGMLHGSGLRRPDEFRLLLVFR